MFVPKLWTSILHSGRKWFLCVSIVWQVIVITHGSNWPCLRTWALTLLLVMLWHSLSPAIAWRWTKQAFNIDPHSNYIWSRHGPGLQIWKLRLGGQLAQSHRARKRQSHWSPQRCSGSQNPHPDSNCQAVGVLHPLVWVGPFLSGWYCRVAQDPAQHCFLSTPLHSAVCRELMQTQCGTGAGMGSKNASWGLALWGPSRHAVVPGWNISHQDSSCPRNANSHRWEWPTGQRGQLPIQCHHHHHNPESDSLSSGAISQDCAWN